MSSPCRARDCRNSRPHTVDDKMIEIVHDPLCLVMVVEYLHTGHAGFRSSAVPKICQVAFPGLGGLPSI